MGGNVFNGKTHSINLEHIKPTLTNYFQELKSLFPKKSEIFDLDHFVALGSVGKKPVSGDIDLGIDATYVIDYHDVYNSVALWGIDDQEYATEFNLLKRRARSATDNQLYLKALLKLIVNHINENSVSIECDRDKTGIGNMFSMFPQYNDCQKLECNVQIDWMVGDIDWLKFSYYSSVYPTDSNIKGLHRTQLMLAAFSTAGLSFGHVDGVKDRETKSIVATTPDQALVVLSERLGFEITRADTEDYYRLHKLLRDNFDDDKYGGLLYTYLKILDNTRADIPDDMQKFWIKRREKFGLTGKFLPETSKLKEYI